MQKLLISATLALSSLVAHAGNTIYGADFGSGSNTYSSTFADGVNATFTSSKPGVFQLKSQDGITGVGISGKTSGEIDIGETIAGSFSKGVEIASIRLGLLFDGPEYKDVNEVAQITAFWTGGGSTKYTLTAKGESTAVWATGSTTLFNATPVPGSVFGGPAVLGGTGAWDLFNPFGTKQVSKLSFTALRGNQASSCSYCTNQSDYTLVSVTAVPEPETYAMMLAGLGLIGAIARRRKAKQA